MDEVNIIVGQLQYEPDSSGMFGPAGLGSHLIVLKAANEASNRKRKREAEGRHKNKDDQEKVANNWSSSNVS